MNAKDPARSRGSAGPSQVGSALRLIRLTVLVVSLISGSGCAVLRDHAPHRDLRPCTEEYARTDDGWNLGVRRYRPRTPDPNKRPVILCHGLGLNATFWTITDDHLPAQLAEHGYEVFVFDLRGSGGSYRDGLPGRVNAILRQSIFPKWQGSDWTVDDVIEHDLPAIISHVCHVTGSDQVEWVGHSLGGMMMFPFLEWSPEADRVANFVGMGSTAILSYTPDNLRMLKANRGLRALLMVFSTSRIARPLSLARPPGFSGIDRFYYTAENVDRLTIDRFYGYTLEDLSRGALRQLDPYLRDGHLFSSDGALSYGEHLDRITSPTLLVAGEGDIMVDVRSQQLTYSRLGSTDKSLIRFGRALGHAHDYGHCDLVWSRYAPREIFPEIIAWLDARQPGAVRPTSQQAPAIVNTPGPMSELDPVWLPRPNEPLAGLGIHPLPEIPPGDSIQTRID